MKAALFTSGLIIGLLGLACAEPEVDMEEPLPEVGEACNEEGECAEDLRCVPVSGSNEAYCRQPCETDTIIPGNPWQVDPSPECPDPEAAYCFNGGCQQAIDD